ncbi:hypothetical protein SSX86_028395 [Deinandra increscens subsp. villosa]|uniref:Uncharacterized protein n=1 Tax=Deinandra increscens subsp. villosa TaxID=3103831 RepID=A0AAP0CCZ0_9ASTR
MKADHSFMVNIESFSHLSNKDHLNPNSRIMRSPSRKGSDNNKTNPNCVMNDGDGDTIRSPKASLLTETMPEKLRLVDLTTDQSNSRPQVHHQITIMTGGTASISASAATAKPPGTPTKTSAMFWKRSRSFKQSSIINPRRILMLFATLSSIGTVLLICLTLSMSRYNEEDNSHA